MPNLENLSPFHAVNLPSMNKEGEELLVICVAGRFDLPPAGRPSVPPSLSEEQSPPVMEDVYWGKPGSSSLRYEGQTAYQRLGTDIYVSGHAWAPRGRPVTEMLAAVRVGPYQKGIHVFGTRVWYRGVSGLKASEPRPFESMPLRYERSFGGTAQVAGNEPPAYEPRNPVGVGLYGSTKEAVEQPLPNLEDPFQLMRSPTDRVNPAGFGPIARNWQPRLGFAGTYDAKWVEQRAPLWPPDFDVRFFNAAAPGLVASPGLKGGEPVVLAGLSPEGQMAFPLPHHRLMVKTVFRHRVDRRELVLDAVQIEPDERALTLLWRAAIPAHRELTHHEYSLVRELEPWEEMPR
ncbi:hypothetical protein BO221_39730 [Archangium sp. Cb G35]|uniref:DUF2169 family type VI secretion system accessory protein n=1 Tax=Archangium sp. Cb G35 TaxID=1920190 RepID=UPI000936CFEA|nr:DUF2169 domain-containing protein [Archangium sp. Cb G35]OJT18849.1 hypothetical protein BO221_39730 [Archangium sp. Cb G35]